jgi:hypothetical protein
MWAFRIAALPIVIILFVLLVRNFYTSDPYAGAYILQFGFTSHAADFRSSVPWVPLSLVLPN